MPQPRPKVLTVVLPAEEITTTSCNSDSANTLFSPGDDTPGHSFHSMSYFKVGFVVTCDSVFILYTVCFNSCSQPG